MNTPAFYTLGEASKATGKAKGTIRNAILKGRLSAEKNDKGEYSINVAELHRVFKPLTTEQGEMNDVSPQGTHPVSHSDIKTLEKEIQMLREMLAKADQQTEKAEANADRWAKQAENLMLTDQRSQNQKSGIFGIFKRK